MTTSSLRSVRSIFWTVLFVGFVAPPLLARGAVVTPRALLIETTIAVEEAGTVRLPIVINDGTDLVGIQFTLTHDPTELVFQRVDPGGSLRDHGLTLNDRDPGRLTAALVSLSLTPLIPTSTSRAYFLLERGTLTQWNVLATPEVTGEGQALSRVGVNGSNAQFWRGRIAELIVYSSHVGPRSRALLEGYLAKEYGLLLTQP